MSTLTSTSSERAALLAMAGNLARRELRARGADLDRCDEAAIAECWRSIVDVGVDRALLSERHGGVELSVGDLLAVIEELAAGDGGIAMCVLLSNAALARLDEAVLAEIPDGARWTLAPVAADARPSFSDGRLDGSLGWVLGACGADGMVLLVDRPTPATWAVRLDAAGVQAKRDRTQMGLRAAAAASVELAGAAAVEVSDAQASSVAMTTANTVALLRAGVAAIARGVARRAYELALEYAEARRQGGVAIVEHEAVADMLSAMAVRLACDTRVLVAPDGLHISPAAALAAKIAATDASVATTTDAVQVFGGTGYMVETGVEKLMRDAKYCQLFPEPNWIAHAELMSVELRNSVAASTRSAAA